MEKTAEKVRAPSGRLVLDIFKDGVLLEHWDVPNLIVDGSKSLLASLLGGTTVNKFVTKVGFGTSAVAPATGNTTLTAPVYKNVDSVTFPATGQVQFNFSLASGEGNGTSISEFGLLTADNTLFSRRIRNTPIVKDATISFTGSWTVTF